MLREVGATGIFGFTNPLATVGSPTEATFVVEPDRVPLAARPRAIADGVSADGARTADGVRPDAAGGLGGAPALPGTRAAGMDAARPGGATWALVPEEVAGPRIAAGVWPRGSCGGEITTRGIGADKTGRWVLLARSALGGALPGGRFDLGVLGNRTGRTSTRGAFRPGLDPWSGLAPWTTGAWGGALSWGTEPAFGGSSGKGVELAGSAGLASGLLISVLTRNAARRTLKMNMAPTRSRAERGHDGRAVRARERAWVTSVVPLSDSSKMPNSMLPVVPSRWGERMRRFLPRPTCSKA